MREELGVSERRACRVLGQHRSTQRRVPTGREDEERLVADMTELVRQYGLPPMSGPLVVREPDRFQVRAN